MALEKLEGVTGAFVNVGITLLVDHDDATREVAYEAGAEKVAALAKERDWSVVSMSNDWKQVFSFG